VTGIIGITFLVTFIPSAISVCLFLQNQKSKLLPVIFIGIIIITSSLLFGMMRVTNHSEGKTITAGIVVLDEKIHQNSDHPDFQKAISVADAYAKEISNLALQGAQIIVLPERAIAIGKENDSSIMKVLSNTAIQNHVFIVTGYTNFKTHVEKNSCLAIDADGNIAVDYNKVHLVTGLENQFTPGNEIGLFEYDKMQAGTAVCKDLDFQKYINNYGKSAVIFLCVPAWDFIKDDWLHSRMAILRGVENGFSEIRNARQGRLSISDYNGKVNFEASSAAGKKAELIGKVSLQRTQTIYTRFGDWFGVLNLIVAICFIVLILFKRK
jgi:apolipoprotein N-acyltransferase